MTADEFDQYVPLLVAKAESMAATEEPIADIARQIAIDAYAIATFPDFAAAWFR